MSPAHHRPERRWPVLLVVVLVLAGVGLVAAARGTSTPAAPPNGPAALAGAPDAESSAWYCTGQSTASGGGGAVGAPVIANTTTRAVTATITAVSETGASEHVSLGLPARSVSSPALPALASGSWQADTVVLSGGGVAVTQAVHGPAGWSQAPCQSMTSAQWYFAGGSTSGSDGLYLSLLNPTSTPVVVDVGFVTSSGAVHPINYEGIVLQPGQVQVEDVSSEVQDVPTVSTVVTARTGRMVATELQIFGGSSPGLALVPGEPTPQPRWTIPQAQETADGASEIDVFNPGTAPERVTLRLRLASGLLAPLGATVAPGTTWAPKTSAQTRIPDGESYSAQIEASGGPGVVVGRTVVLPASSSSPQAGMATGVGGLSAASPSGEWVVPPPGTSAGPAVSSAAPASLAVCNDGDAVVRYSAYSQSPSGDHVLATGELAPGGSVVVSGSALSAAGLDQIIVRAPGTLAISEDVAPSGGVGVVTMPGIPLAAPIGA